VELQEGLGLGLVSDQKPNVSVSSRSRKLRSRLHPCHLPWLSIVTATLTVHLSSCLWPWEMAAW